MLNGACDVRTQGLVYSILATTAEVCPGKLRRLKYNTVVAGSVLSSVDCGLAGTVAEELLTVPRKQ